MKKGVSLSLCLCITITAWYRTKSAASQAARRQCGEKKKGENQQKKKHLVSINTGTLAFPFLTRSSCSIASPMLSPSELLSGFCSETHSDKKDSQLHDKNLTKSSDTLQPGLWTAVRWLAKLTQAQYIQQILLLGTVWKHLLFQMKRTSSVRKQAMPPPQW